MNITLLVGNETFTYNLLDCKIVSDGKTLLCFKFDSFPSDNDIKTAFLKHFNISGSFDEFIHSIDLNSLLNEKCDTLYLSMMTILKAQNGVERLQMLFKQSQTLLNKSKSITSVGLNNRAFASFYKTPPSTNSEMFLAACGEPCKPVNEARFDNIPKSGEVLRYLPINTPIPDPHFATKIKAEYRGLLNGARDSANISFLRSISKEVATFVPFGKSELHDFSFSSPNLDNKAHILVLEALPSIVGKRTLYKQLVSSSIVFFFADRFCVNSDVICALPNAEDFIKYYLLDFSSTSATHKHFDYWISTEGQGKILAAAF